MITPNSAWFVASVLCYPESVHPHKVLVTSLVANLVIDIRYGLSGDDLSIWRWIRLRIRWS